MVCNDGNVCGTEICEPSIPSSCPNGQVCQNCTSCVTQGCTSDSQCTNLSDQCNLGVCNLGTGTCQRQARQNGTSCSDGNACTVNDRCSSGSCIGDPHCGDGIVQGSCNEQCDGSPTGCAAGQTCTNMCLCTGGGPSCPGGCDDGNECTLDQCVSGVCQHSCQAFGTSPCGRGECRNGNVPCSAPLACVATPESCKPKAAGKEGPPGTPTCSNGKDDDCNGLSDSSDPACAPCGSLRFEFVDPTPNLVKPDGTLSTALADQAAQRTVRAAIATDGLSQALIKIWVPGRGQVHIALAGGGSRDTDGYLTDPAGGSPGDAISVSALAYGTSYLAVAAYHAPATFPATQQDATSLDRKISLVIDYAPESGAPRGPCDLPITLVRPPVLLVHGWLSNPTSAWRSLLGRFFPDGVNMSACPVHKPTDATSSPPTPWFICTADYEDFNDEKFAYGAAAVAKRLDQTVESYRDWAPYRHTGGIIATGADVIAHSMGGVVVRALAMCKPVDGLFADCAAMLPANKPTARGENYFKGGVRRLITIGTPHQGTALAGRLLTKLRQLTRFDDDPQCDCRCTTSGTAGSTCASIICTPATKLLRQYGLSAGEEAPEGTALEDMTPGSRALLALKNNPDQGVLAHLIVGDASDNDKIGGNGILRGIDDRCDPDIFLGRFETHGLEMLLGSENDIIVSGDSQRALSDIAVGATSTLDPMTDPLIHATLLDGPLKEAFKYFGIQGSASSAEVDSVTVYLLLRGLLHAGPGVYGQLPKAP